MGNQQCCRAIGNEHLLVCTETQEAIGMGSDWSIGPKMSRRHYDDTNEDLHQMNRMNILEFERRVKQFAFPENKGFINQFQLIEAFKDTKIFAHMSDMKSIKTQFILSPFVANF